MQFFKRHWFGFFISIIIFSYTFLFVMIMISPKQDIQKRGFVACTEKFVDDSSGCRGGICMIKNILNNNFCDFTVIGQGLSLWVKGEQKFPWSNYIFEPELQKEEIDEGLQEFYDENPSLIYDIEKLKKLHEELEKTEPVKIEPVEDDLQIVEELKIEESKE